MDQSGLVLDVYDDSGGEVLRSIFPTEADIPERVKTAHSLSLEERDRLPDDLFALVLVDGGEKLRKYACVDSGNTVLSTVYFMKTAGKLPAEAQKLAAENLCEAHRWYGLQPPAALEKFAFGVGTALSVLTAPSIVKGTHQSIKNNMAAVRGLEGQGNIVTPQNLRQAKFGEAAGTDIMPLSAPSGAEIKSKAVIRKTAATVAGEKAHWGETLHNGDGTPGEQPASLPQARQVHFVVTKDQTAHPAITEKKAETYALGQKFPLDNLLQIKAAAAYFDEYGKRFSPEDRRTFCSALVKTAAKLNLPLSDDVRKYGSPVYAPLSEMKVAQDLRRNLLAPQAPERAVLDRLFEKRADIAPDIFCEALGELDRMTGLDFYYDRAIPDSYASTFGMEKRAEDFSEIIGNEMATETDLRRLGRNGGIILKNTFSDDFCAEFQKDPVGIFKSLPRDQKLVVMRMANGTAPGEPTGG
jgi:hypothetical protein